VARVYPVGDRLTFLDPERFERFRVRAGGRMIIAMSLGRIAGKAVKVEGGYRISGRWPFASGSPFATWLGGMSVVSDSGGSAVLDSGGQPQRLLAIWPADQARLIDTWDGLGLVRMVFLVLMSRSLMRPRTIIPLSLKMEWYTTNTIRTDPG
jgi:hypothetical protein